ncbi:unnamed protein product [Hydatigera taeniaeformis]|uniref:Uncharacterized protein n=1 Tax=Hydatigena taeniaeformis TaxID=6205 RepID=A0A0R3WJN3_HYDTA|nr:unnamed protein product [Hydatigera taeniaeformis]
MASDMAVSKLDISKNLLQMNFMRRTLIALEKLEKPAKQEELPSMTEFQFPMPQPVVDVLRRRLEVVSRRPVVRHVPGRIGVANFGLRASYGGFNLYLSAESNATLKAPGTEVDQKVNVGIRQKFTKRRSSSNRKRRSHGGLYRSQSNLQFVLLFRWIFLRTGQETH